MTPVSDPPREITMNPSFETLLRRQLDWLRAAFGLYPHPGSRLESFVWKSWEGYRDRFFPKDQVQGILESYLSRRQELRPMHQSRHRSTYRFEPQAGQPKAVFLKYYRSRILPLYDPKSYLRLRQPLKAFRLSYLLASKGIETARALFFLRDREGGIRADAILATEGVSDSADLRGWMSRSFPHLDEAKRDRFVLSLGRYLGALHLRGVMHGDLASNLLVIPEEGRYPMLDLDSIRIVGAILPRDRESQLRRFIGRIPELKCDHRRVELFYRAYGERFAQGLGNGI